MTATPSPTALSGLSADLDALAAKGRLRGLIPNRGVDFASNDYLGFASHPALAQAAQAALARGVPIGSGGSRLLRGNHPEHEALEAEAAAFFGGESALFLPTGFTANSALLATMPQRGDMIFHDRLIHASMHEGLRLTKAGHKRVAHNDVGAFADALAAWRNGGGMGTAWIVVESLYSMDGDCAPLAELSALASAQGAMLVVDEAHATGIFGPGGRGMVTALGARGPNVITLHTCGKALGVEGALLVGPAVMREYLVNCARGFIFSTAPSPLMAAVVRAALRLCEGADETRADLLARVDHARAALAPFGAQCHGSPILPLVLGGDVRTMAVASALQNRGLDVRGIRPPTVPEGTARLRIVITGHVGKPDITALATALGEVL